MERTWLIVWLTLSRVRYLTWQTTTWHPSQWGRFATCLRYASSVCATTRSSRWTRTRSPDCHWSSPSTWRRVNWSGLTGEDLLAVGISPISASLVTTYRGWVPLRSSTCRRRPSCDDCVWTATRGCVTVDCVGSTSGSRQRRRSTSKQNDTSRSATRLICCTAYHGDTFCRGSWHARAASSQTVVETARR